MADVIQMSVTSQVFVVFYAVLYGVLFTISSRWQPFFIQPGSKEGRWRLLLAWLFYGVLPVVYFLRVFPFWLSIKRFDTLPLGVAVWSVAPLAAFHFIWVWIIAGCRTSFYSSEELASKLMEKIWDWVGQERGSCGLKLVVLGLFLVGPILTLFLFWRYSARA